MRTHNKTILFFLLLSIFIGCRSTDDEPPIHSSRIMSYSKIASSAAAQMEHSSGSHTSSQSLPQKRMIIKTATMTCEVSNYNETFSAIEKIVTGKDGFIINSSIHSTEEYKKSGSMTVRIPSSVFEETLEDVSKLSSKVLSKSINGNDITGEFYDVVMHLENKKKVESRYREILKSAKTVKDILQIEEALGNVREEIDGLEGRKLFLADQTALSTIKVNLQEPQAIVMVEGEGFWVKIANGFRHGLTGFADVLSFCITICISAIPASILLFLVVLFAIWFARYLKSRKQSTGKKEKK